MHRRDLCQAGRSRGARDRLTELNRFLFELAESDELDAETKAVFAEVAQDRTFLSALDDYVHGTRLLH